jgi:hypothetical protein
MTKSEGQEICKLRVNAEAQTLQAAREESLASPPSIYFPHEETIPSANSIVVQIRHFRSPPTLG